ncbi:MAG: DUF1501 domain-containing protein [Planctomycetota bacterium]|nr:DUF1501 domain-containing protein [Planctomycetota bacterium]
MSVNDLAAKHSASRGSALERREFLYGLGQGIGSVALSSMLLQDQYLSAAEPADPLQVKAPHRTPRAKSVIFLFMYGGPSQMDTFDPKPVLQRYHGKPVTRIYGGGGNGDNREERLYVGTPFRFKQHGQCGQPVSELFPNLATCVDNMAFLRSMHVDSAIHPMASFQMNLGTLLPGSPSMGSWVLYGLGTENRDLPGFVVLADRGLWSGAVNYSNGFLPAQTQGTLLNPSGGGIADLQPPEGVTRGSQQASIDLLNDLNRPYLSSDPQNTDLVARMRNYELAFRMQSAVPEAMDLGRETAAVRDLYGLDHKVTQPMGERCLMARRLVERGVRFVQVYSHGWDSHDRIAQHHRRRAQETDRPIAGLIKDLKQRGLLDDTLIVWCGEFGRTPDNHKGFFATYPGRDHNKEGMIAWFAGGGIRPGTTVGSTDEFGLRAAENGCHLHDMHATILHMLGLNDMDLTYYHGGRFKRLTDLGGQVIQELIA